MPLRPENRQFYDTRWRKFRLALLEAAGHVCQRCRRPHRLLNVAHLTHDPDREFLSVLSAPVATPATIPASASP